VNPKFAFEQRSFTFTGESSRAPRQTLCSSVAALSGTTADAVTKRTHYLIVCDGGNPHWAFACYGRKVEKAYHMRRQGHPITIAHELDLWTALVAHGITV
jgi:NAD-dependent DNA ligase